MGRRVRRGRPPHDVLQPDERVAGATLDRCFGVGERVAFGKQRLVSPLPWGNTLRTWDGLRVDVEVIDVIDAERGWILTNAHVVSRSPKSLGPNATQLGDDLESAIRRLKSGQEGELEVAGPNLARSLTELGLIDEYRIYLHPVVLGQGTPYFAGPGPRLRLVTHDRIGEDVIRLSYVPA